MDHSWAMAAIGEWVSRDENVRAVLVTGSVASASGQTDPLSDLDVELYAIDPGPLLEDASWYHQFGDVLVVEALPNPGWHPTRLVHYVDGKIDFAVADVASCRHSRHDRPVRVLVDKDGLMVDLDQPPTEGVPPRAEDIEECVNWFYAAALMEAKLLARRERWQAKFREWDMMGQLLRMVEWDHRARYGWGYDTWYHGKKMSQWADADIREAAEACWAPYDVPLMAASLSHAVELFAHLAERVSNRAASPPFDHNRVIAEVRRLLAAGGTTT